MKSSRDQQLIPPELSKFRTKFHDALIISHMMQVFFDGSCPMCVREVAVYRRASPADIMWHDLSSPTLDIPVEHSGYQPSRTDLLKRFHVYNHQGRWLHGAAAFVCLWQKLAPVWRMLASIGRLPGGLWLMDAVYELFLKVRPRMQRWALSWIRPDELPVHMIASIRSDHAGETGAVWIYRSMLWFSRDPDLRSMLEHHMKQEQVHLDAMNRLLPWRFRSRLIPLWVLAGIATGVIPALLGRAWILGTIAAVESFVDVHYLEQIHMLEAEPKKSSPSTSLGYLDKPAPCLEPDQCGIKASQTPSAASGPTLSRLSGYPDLLTMLKAFRHDELDHREEAMLQLGAAKPSKAFELWCSLVGQGSAIAVRFAKAI